MKIKKTASLFVIVAFALLAYNTFDTVKAETTAIEGQEVSPFAITNQTKLKVEDIQPAILMEMKPEVNELVKEDIVKEDDKEVISSEEKAPASLKIEEKEVKEVAETVKEEDKVIEEKKELPVLEDIKLPDVSEKPVNNEPVKIEVSSQRIPAGTIIPLKLESPINSVISNMGDQFNATLTSDVMVGDNIVLPAGSVVRGTIGKMRKAGMFVKEARVMLIFDHIVTPAGKQVPLYGYMANSNIVNYEGYITGGTSYGKAFKNDASKGKDIVVKSTTFGVDKGLKYLAGAPVILTAPICAIGGALGGSGYIIGKSVYNIFNKGGEVILEPGTPLELTLSKALDIPVN